MVRDLVNESIYLAFIDHMCSMEIAIAISLTGAFAFVSAIILVKDPPLPDS